MTKIFIEYGTFKKNKNIFKEGLDKLKKYGIICIYKIEKYDCSKLLELRKEILKYGIMFDQECIFENDSNEISGSDIIILNEFRDDFKDNFKIIIDELSGNSEKKLKKILKIIEDKS